MPPFLAHVFCNIMGIPPLGWALQVWPEKKKCASELMSLSMTRSRVLTNGAISTAHFHVRAITLSFRAESSHDNLFFIDDHHATQPFTVLTSPGSAPSSTASGAGPIRPCCSVPGV